MPLTVPRSWKEEFAFAAAMRREDIRHREKIVEADALARERADEIKVRQARKEKEAAALEAILVPRAKIIAFHTRLDTYDAKTVEALMQNQDAIDAVRKTLDDMLNKAHVLPDGRRVFKTLDGQRVFDQHGEQLASDVIDPKRIDDKNPRWETFKDNLEQRERLQAERRGLHDFQERLDRTRERLDTDNITEKDLERMDAELASAMPDGVRRKLGLETAADKERAPATTSVPQDMEVLMRSTGFGPASPG